MTCTFGGGEKTVTVKCDTGVSAANIEVAPNPSVRSRVDQLWVLVRGKGGVRRRFVAVFQAVRSPAPVGAWCTATAVPANDGYTGDYNVLVNSNQLNQRVTASDSNDSYSYTTDGSGYADVYLWYTSPGERVTVMVGGARCTTTAQA